MNYGAKEVRWPLVDCNRNVTIINWFTSVFLTDEILRNLFKYTVAGIIDKNKRETPKEKSARKGGAHGRQRSVSTNKKIPWHPILFYFPLY